MLSARELMGVQAAGSSYMYEAWKTEVDILTKRSIKAQTVADSISAGLPRDRIKALAAVKETGGAYLSIEDKDILAAIPELARGCGVFAEPAGAAAYAGLVQAARENMVSRDERIVVLNTGHGLKDVAGAMQAVEQVGTTPVRVEPNLDALKDAVDSWKI